MRIPTFLTLFIVLMLGASAAAQPGGDDGVSSEDAGFRSYNTIDSVSITPNYEGDGYELVINTFAADGCNIPAVAEIMRRGDVLFIDIFRDMPIGIACPMVLLPQEVRVPADDDMLGPDADGTPVAVIVINQSVYGVMRDGEIPTLTPYSAQPLAVSLSAVPTPEGVEVVAEWLPPDGCEAPLVYRVLPVAYTMNQYSVDFYRALPADVDPAADCPPAPRFIAPNRTVMQSSHDPQTAADFRLSEPAIFGSLLRYEPDFAEDFDIAQLASRTWMSQQVELADEGVEVLVLESFPPQISLQMMWREGGPCPLSYHTIRTEETDDQIAVTLTHHVAEDSPCGRALFPRELSINLDSFTPGNVPQELEIDVNGVKRTVDL